MSVKQARLKELSFLIKCNKEKYIEQVKNNDKSAEETRQLLYKLLDEYKQLKGE